MGLLHFFSKAPLGVYKPLMRLNKNKHLFILKHLFCSKQEQFFNKLFIIAITSVSWF